MSNLIESLASDLQHEKRSKSSIKKEFGYNTLKLVNAELRKQRKKSRVEDSEPCDPSAQTLDPPPEE